ncbi:MAG: phosphatidate cytidylyltransferase [Myroides sp.]|nr:phosphatidate cytidylyltransferase [Myroides sp.]
MNEVVKRTLSGIVYIILLVGAILYSVETFLLLFAVFFITAVIEFCKLYQINKIYGLLLSVVIAVSLFFLNNHPYNSALLCVVPFSIFLMIDLFQNQSKKEQTLFKKLIHLIGYVTLPFLIITQLPYLNGNYSRFLLLSIFIMIWCNDTFAYICGRLLGKHKLYEKISPKKTIEGFIGGLLFTQLAAFIIYKTSSLQISLIAWLLIALGISVLGTVGDLIESKYKRQAGVKDSGNIMPGHGGILDRFDSILFAAPFLFLIYKILI